MARLQATGDVERRTVKKDFILLSEFAEIRHGPQPICTIPAKGEGEFDTGSFSVRVFSTDFQQGQEEEFDISPDSQVLITEPKDGAYAYVHYFALNDIQARGYLRQYCLCYITNTPSKLTDNFEKLQKDFFEVTALFKCGNHRVFGKDLEHRLADLEYSKELLETNNEEVDDDIPEYDCQTEDIPETSLQVIIKDISYINNIMKSISQEMRKESNVRIQQWIETNRLIMRVNEGGDVSDSFVKAAGNSKFYTTHNFTRERVGTNATEGYQPKRVMAHLAQRFSRQLRSLDELSVGSFSLAMSALKDIHKKYSQSDIALQVEQMETALLSPVSSLLSVGRVPLCNVLQYKYESRDCSHLLHTHHYTVSSTSSHDELQEGHCVTQQLIDSGQAKCLDTSFIYKDDPYKLPLYLDVVPRQRGLSIVDPLGSPSVLPQIGRSHSSRLSCSSYNTPDIFPTPSASPTVEETSHDNIPISHEVSHDDTSIDIICSNELVQSNQTKTIWDHNDIDDDETISGTNCKITLDTSLSNGDHNHFMPNQPIALSRHMSLDNLASLPSNHSLVVSMERKKPHALLPTLDLPSQERNYTDEHNFYTPLTAPFYNCKSTSPLFSFDNLLDCVGLPSSKGSFPFVSSVDLIENNCIYKPGKDALLLLKDLPEMRDILYSLLSGQTFVIIANQKDEKLVRRHIRALWIFVGGHSSHYQIIPWQSKPLQMRQLTQVRLIGLSSSTSPLPNYLKKHVAYWDWTKNILSTPTYNGNILNPILSRARDKKNEELFLSIVESVLADLALKTFLCFHGFYTQSEYQLCLRQPKPTPEISARKFYSVAPRKDKIHFLSGIGIKDSDVDIIDHWINILRQQQLTQWRTHCSPQHILKDLDIVILNMKYCQERPCKPKRL